MLKNLPRIRGSDIVKKIIFFLLFLLLIYGACAKRPPTPIASNTVLLAGDSIMAGMGPEIANQLKGTGNYRFIQKGKVSSGLCRPEFHDWPAKLKRLMIEHHPRLVLFCIGTNDTQSISTKKFGSVPFLSSEWKDEYKMRLGELIRTAREYGADIAFLSPPVMGRKNLNSGVQHINAIIRSVCREQHVQYVDLWYRLADKNGQFQRYMTIGHERVEIRAKDGVHVRKRGNQLLAQKAINDLQALLFSHGIEGNL